MSSTTMSIEGSSRISPASVVIRSKATGTLRVFDASRTRIRLISMGPPERWASCSACFAMISTTPEPTVPRPISPTRTGECKADFLSAVTSNINYSILGEGLKTSLHQIEGGIRLSVDAVQQLGEGDKFQAFGADAEDDPLQRLDGGFPVAPLPADQRAAVVKEQDVAGPGFIHDAPDDGLGRKAPLPIEAGAVPKDHFLAEKGRHPPEPAVVQAARGPDVPRVLAGHLQDDGGRPQHLFVQALGG